MVSNMNNNPFIQRQMEIRQHMIGGFIGILVASDEVEKAEPVFDENLFEKAECYIDDLEKAHQDGDIHPKHPNWVWVSSAAGGKGDWRAMGGRAHKKHQETNGTSKKEEGGDEQKQGNEQPQAKTIADHASETKTETLEKVANSNAPEKLKEIAKKELKKREGHKDGDVHPKHSDWVWVSSAAGGKGDWRKAGGKAHQKHQASQQQTKQDDNDKKTKSSANMPKVDKFMDALSVSSSKYSDINKVAVMKTPKGNWDTYYDGKRVGIINGSTLSDADAKKLGIITTDDARAHSQRSTAKQDAGSQNKPKIDETTIDQSEYDKAYKTATSKEETEKHLKESLAKIDSNIKETKNALQDASDATAGKLQKMLTASISKKKAIEDALKQKTSGIDNFDDFKKKYGTDTATPEGRINFWTESLLGQLKNEAMKLSSQKFDGLMGELAQIAYPSNSGNEKFALSVCNVLLNGFSDDQKNARMLKGKYSSIMNIKTKLEDKISGNATQSYSTGGLGKTPSSAKKTESSSAIFTPKRAFKNAYHMAREMNKFLPSIDMQQFVDILGDTKYDKGAGTKYREIRTGSGMYDDWKCSTSSYLQKDGSGDYLEFENKPSQEKLDKCAKLLKKQLAKEGYDVEPKFTVLSHNSYYQHPGTFGIGISINVTKKEWKSSSKDT